MTGRLVMPHGTEPMHQVGANHYAESRRLVGNKKSASHRTRFGNAGKALSINAGKKTDAWRPVQ